MRALLLFTLALATLALAVASTVSAQTVGKLAGQVLDREGHPAPGATVLVGGTQLGAATDIDGNYVILGIPYGAYDVRVEYLDALGHYEQVGGPVQIESRHAVVLDFELDEPVEYDWTQWERPIVISCGIGAPTVVHGEDIERLPVRGVVPDAVAPDSADALSAYSRRKKERFGAEVE